MRTDLSQIMLINYARERERKKEEEKNFSKSKITLSQQVFPSIKLYAFLCICVFCVCVIFSCCFYYQLMLQLMQPASSRNSSSFQFSIRINFFPYIFSWSKAYFNLIIIIILVSSSLLVLSLIFSDGFEIDGIIIRIIIGNNKISKKT